MAFTVVVVTVSILMIIHSIIAILSIISNSGLKACIPFDGTLPKRCLNFSRGNERLMCIIPAILPRILNVLGVCLLDKTSGPSCQKK